MCAGALVLARIDRLVLGAPDPKAGFAGSLGDIVRDGRLNHEVEVTVGVLAEECGEVLRAFFAEAALVGRGRPMGGRTAIPKTVSPVIGDRSLAETPRLDPLVGGLGSALLHDRVHALGDRGDPSSMARKFRSCMTTSVTSEVAATVAVRGVQQQRHLAEEISRPEVRQVRPVVGHLGRPGFDHHELVGIRPLVHQVLVRRDVDLVSPPLQTLVLVVGQALEQGTFRSRSAFIGASLRSSRSAPNPRTGRPEAAC